MDGRYDENLNKGRTMDDYEDESDGCAEEATPARPGMFTLNIDLSALQSMLDERVPHAVLEQVDVKIGGWLKELVQKEAATLIKATVQERVAEIVRELLEQGWERTDDYGQSKGRFTLKEHVAKAVREAERNRDITRVILEAWDKELNTVWKKALSSIFFSTATRASSFIAAKLPPALSCLIPSTSCARSAASSAASPRE